MNSLLEPLAHSALRNGASMRSKVLPFPFGSALPSRVSPHLHRLWMRGPNGVLFFRRGGVGSWDDGTGHDHERTAGVLRLSRLFSGARGTAGVGIQTGGTLSPSRLRELSQPDDGSDGGRLPRTRLALLEQAP